METLKTLWDSIYNADSWEEFTLIVAILTTFITSLLFSFRMYRYKDKNLLDTMIMFREFGWALLAFRYISALGFHWSWSGYSWIIWLYIGTTTGLTYLASIREHILNNNKDDAVLEKEIVNVDD